MRKHYTNGGTFWLVLKNVRVMKDESTLPGSRKRRRFSHMRGCGPEPKERHLVGQLGDLNRVCSLENRLYQCSFPDFDIGAIVLKDVNIWGTWVKDVQDSALFCNFFKVLNYFRMKQKKKA